MYPILSSTIWTNSNFTYRRKLTIYIFIKLAFTDNLHWSHISFYNPPKTKQNENQQEYKDFRSNLYSTLGVHFQKRSPV